MASSTTGLKVGLARVEGSRLKSNLLIETPPSLIVAYSKRTTRLASVASHPGNDRAALRQGLLEHQIIESIQHLAGVDPVNAVAQLAA